MTLAQMYELYQHDYAAFVDVEDVTYQDSAASLAAVKARKCVPRTAELAGVGANVQLQADLATFVLWDVSFAGHTPKAGGKLTWHGTTWTIISLRRERFDTQWRCVCRPDK